jgi:hypothetical protein
MNVNGLDGDRPLAVIQQISLGSSNSDRSCQRQASKGCDNYYRGLSAVPVRSTRCSNAPQRSFKGPSKAVRCLLGTYVVGVFEVQTRDDNPRTLEKAAEKGSFDRSPVGGTPREMKRIYWTTKGGRIAYCACSSLGGGGRG